MSLLLHLENGGCCTDWKARSRPSSRSVIGHPSGLAYVGYGALTSRDPVEWWLLFTIGHEAGARRPTALGWFVNGSAHARDREATAAMHWRPPVTTMGTTALVGRRTWRNEAYTPPPPVLGRHGPQ